MSFGSISQDDINQTKTTVSLGKNYCYENTIDLNHSKLASDLIFDTFVDDLQRAIFPVRKKWT